MDKILPKFRGIKAYEEESGGQLAIEEPDVSVRSLKRKSLEIDPKLKVESNEKRLKSLKEKLDSDKRQQSLVKEAISSGKRLNKRIVFDTDIDDGLSVTKIGNSLSEEKRGTNDNSAEISFQRKKKLLFDSDSDEDNNNEDIDGNEDNNRLKDFDVDYNKKINDKNAEKLIELNSRFAHDSRFRIDERFLDQIDDNNDDNEVVDEEKKNLHLLEEVLGKKLKPIIKSSDKKSKNLEKNNLFVTRFDPNSEKSLEFELNSSSIEKKKSDKKVSFDQKISEKQVVNSGKPEEEVSKEVYYEVSSSLKDSLSQKEEQFSLTQMFGSSHDEDVIEKDSTEDQRVEPFHEKLDNKKKSTVLQRNPFKYDSSSSDDDEEEEEEEEEDEDNDIVVETKSDLKVNNKTKPVSSGFRFFFGKDDSRLNEDIFWNKDLVQKSKNCWKDRQILLIRSMSVRKRSAKKNKKSEQKTYLKYKKNPNFKRFSKNVDNQSVD